MEGSNTHNHGYWFVVREDQGNVLFNSNNITATQNPHILPVQEQPCYILETDNRHFPQVVEVPPSQDSESGEKAARKWHKEREDFWDRNKVKLLLTVCLENKDLDKEILWAETSRVVGASPEQCRNKYAHLRRTYLRLARNKRMGKNTKWVHYSICEEIFTDLKAVSPSMLEPWEDHKVRKLLNLYLEFLPRFRNPDCLQKEIWREIGAKMGTTSYNCFIKFKTLKRSYLKCLNNNCGKSIKWAYYQYFESIYHNYNPQKAWSRQKIRLLLDAYGQIAHKFKNPKLQKKDLWNEISMTVGESADACDKKFRNLKQTFVRLRIKASCGKPTTKWRYYREFEALYNNSSRYIEIDGKISYPSDQDDYITKLLDFYIMHKDKFKDPLTKNKPLWKMIAPKLGLSADECDKKFRNLKQTFVRLAWKKKQTGKCSKWPYFAYFNKIYDAEEIPYMCSGGNESFGQQSQPTLGQTVRELQERRDSHKRFERLARLAEESNQIQRERNKILQALLDRNSRGID